MIPFGPIFLLANKNAYAPAGGWLTPSNDIAVIDNATLIASGYGNSACTTEYATIPATIWPPMTAFGCELKMK